MSEGIVYIAKLNEPKTEKGYILRKMRRADGIEDDYTIYDENEGVYLAILRDKKEIQLQENITRKRRFLLPRYDRKSHSGTG